MKRVTVDAQKCVGCRVCEMVCSSTHFGAYSHDLSRIRVVHTYPIPSAPVVCRQCDDPKCVEACPTGALVRGEWVEYHEDQCISCNLCVEACPYNEIWPGPGEKVLKCDTCQGTFQCVEACPEQALGIAEG
ncbi:MAG: 4Fe-4S dicluster domain-containing protein [Bacillota bacterium]